MPLFSGQAYQVSQLVVQDDASSSKADADQDSNGHAPVSPAYAEKSQVLAVIYGQVLFLNLICFCLLMHRTDMLRLVAYCKCCNCEVADMIQPVFCSVLSRLYHGVHDDAMRLTKICAGMCILCVMLLYLVVEDVHAMGTLTGFALAEWQGCDPCATAVSSLHSKTAHLPGWYESVTPVKVVTCIQVSRSIMVIIVLATAHLLSLTKVWQSMHQREV